MATVPSPITWVVGQVVTAAQMNSNVRDVDNFLLSPVRAQIRQTVSQSIPNNLAPMTPVSMDTVDIDNDGMWTTGLNTRLTCQTAGRYAVSAIFGGLQAANAAAAELEVSILLNGNQTRSASFMAINASTNACSVAVSELVLSVGDYVQLGVYQATGAAANTRVTNGAQSILRAVRISS